MGRSLENSSDLRVGRQEADEGVFQQWGLQDRFGFAIKITSGRVSTEQFWEGGGLSEISGGVFPHPIPGGFRGAGG